MVQRFNWKRFQRVARADYLSVVKPDFRFEALEKKAGSSYFKFSLGLNDAAHPGLPEKQLQKIRIAKEHGVALFPVSIPETS